MNPNFSYLAFSIRVVLAGVFFTCAPALLAVEEIATRPKEQPVSALSQAEVDKYQAFREALEQYHGVLNEYQDSITGIEDNYGVYDRRLIAPLLGQGLAQQAQNDHAGAIQTFRRAEHLTRVNMGPDHLAQVPVLGRLVESYSTTRDWDQAGKTRLHILQIQRRNYQRNDRLLLASVDNLMRWYLYYFEQSRGLESVQALLKARAMSIELVDLIETHHPDQQRRLAVALDRQAQIDFELTRFQDKLIINGDPSLQTLNDQAASVPDVGLNAYDLLAYKPYGEGEQALLKRAELFDRIQSATLNERIDSRLRLGDWYLISNDRIKAVNSYKKAYELAAETPEATSRLNFLFSKPRSLHFNLFYESERSPRNTQQKSEYVDFVFEVTGVGSTRKIEILDSDAVRIEDNNLREMMLAARYRPRMIDGELIATEGVTYRYKY
jgi:hypothetical protein